MSPKENSLFAALEPQAQDTVLSLIGQFRQDPRPDKLDLGVGVYRDLSGMTPVMSAVKVAEIRLLSQQTTKAYLGPEGDLGFLEALSPMVVGPQPGRAVYAMQTPGGTGAVRLAADLIAAARPQARIFMGLPTWQNHPQIFARAGLRTGLYCHFDAHTQQLCFDEMLAALERGDPGDAVLLHGCCHNPTGADLSVAQWEAVAETIARRELLPLIDLAYQGLGGGLEEDVVGLRHVLSAVPDVLVAYSCDKNFGLYRERVGALFAVCASRARRDVVADNARALARTNWSMPPDHGAAVVRIVLQNANLAGEWRAELETMRHRLADVRQALAAAVPDLKMLAEHRGLFAQLALGPAQVEAMRRRHGVYMTDTGRINLAGLTASNIPHFAEAYANRQEEVLA